MTPALKERKSPRERIAELIASARKEREMSQQTLAHHAGTTAARISEIESGRVNVRFDTLEKVSRALGLEITLVA